MTPDPPFPPCRRQSIQKTSWATSLPGRGGAKAPRSSQWRHRRAPSGAHRILAAPADALRIESRAAAAASTSAAEATAAAEVTITATAATAATATGRHRQQPHRYHCRHRPQTLPSPHPAAEPRRRHRRRPTRPQTPQTSPWASPLALQHLELDGLRVDRASAESLLSTIAY